MKMSKSRTITAGMLGVIFSLCLLFIMLVTSVEAVCYWTPGYFEQEYEKYDVLSDLPPMTMSEEDGLMAVTEHMMHYLRGDEGYDELQIEVMMDGELRGFFSEREIAHMEDVRVLFVGAQRLRVLSLIICAASLAVMYLLCRSDMPYVLSRSVLLGTGILLVLLGGLAYVLATDFSDAFVTFHHIFFDNDLWILDPRVDMLINIVPEGFFFDTAMRIAAIFGGCVAAVLGLSAFWAIRTRRRQD